jgi:hypothetical protein
MIQPSLGRFSQIDREELDDEQIISCPSRSTHEAIILRLDAGVGFAVVFGDVARCSKTSWKMSSAHGASEYLGSRPFKTEVVSLAINTGSTCMAGTARRHPLGDAARIFGVLTEHSVGSGIHRSRSLLLRKFFPLLELLGWHSVRHLWGWWGEQNRGLDSIQQGTLRLLHDGGAEDSSQPLVHLAHAVGGGCQQRIQGHVVIPLDEPPVAQGGLLM